MLFESSQRLENVLGDAGEDLNDLRQHVYRVRLQDVQSEVILAVGISTLSLEQLNGV